MSIDLHLHTTASDGRRTPRELVDLARQVGLRVMAVTDHDTTAAVVDVRQYAAACGIDAISGIEITSVHEGVDVHILGYFLDPDDKQLSSFLAAQRATRLQRVKAIAERVTELGMPIDVERILLEARRNPNRSVGRPQVARALVAQGYVADTREAFEMWLGRGRPAFVERPGAPPSDVVALIQAAGGLAAIAHPGRTAIDDLIPQLAASGLDAIEVYHSDHDEVAIAHYAHVAKQHNLLVTGGSDYHGDPARDLLPGSSTLPLQEWERLRGRLRDGHGGQARHS